MVSQSENYTVTLDDVGQTISVQGAWNTAEHPEIVWLDCPVTVVPEVGVNAPSIDSFGLVAPTPLIAGSQITTMPNPVVTTDATSLIYTFNRNAISIQSGPSSTYVTTYDDDGAWITATAEASNSIYNSSNAPAYPPTDANADGGIAIPEISGVRGRRVDSRCSNGPSCNRALTDPCGLQRRFRRGRVHA